MLKTLLILRLRAIWGHDLKSERPGGTFPITLSPCGSYDHPCIHYSRFVLSTPGPVSSRHTDIYMWFSRNNCTFYLFAETVLIYAHANAVWYHEGDWILYHCTEICR